MAALVFDTGALIALDRGNRAVGALLEVATREGLDAITSSTCVAQAWRDPARQARLTRALAGFLELPLDGEHARKCGLLLGNAGTSDIVDAALVLATQDGDTVLTSDPGDIGHLLACAGTRASIYSV